MITRQLNDSHLLIIIVTLIQQSNRKPLAKIGDSMVSTNKLEYKFGPNSLLCLELIYRILSCNIQRALLVWPKVHTYFKEIISSYPLSHTSLLARLVNILCSLLLITHLNVNITIFISLYGLIH